MRHSQRLPLDSQVKMVMTAHLLKRVWRFAFLKSKEQRIHMLSPARNISEGCRPMNQKFSSKGRKKRNKDYQVLFFFFSFLLSVLLLLFSLTIKFLYQVCHFEFFSPTSPSERSAFVTTIWPGGPSRPE